tara:strand:+ start:226 stop:399 length:174 start_codon:yes stop_codon:yes gene_type:complete
MGKAQKHYDPDGKLYTGKTHKMPDGTLHSGAEHSDKSVVLTHKKPKKSSVMREMSNG